MGELGQGGRAAWAARKRLGNAGRGGCTPPTQGPKGGAAGRTPLGQQLPKVARRVLQPYLGRRAAAGLGCLIRGEGGGSGLQSRLRPGQAVGVGQ